MSPASNASKRRIGISNDGAAVSMLHPFGTSASNGLACVTRRFWQMPIFTNCGKAKTRRLCGSWTIK